MYVCAVVSLLKVLNISNSSAIVIGYEKDDFKFVKVEGVISVLNVLKKLFLDPYLKNQNWAFLWINSVKF